MARKRFSLSKFIVGLLLLFILVAGVGLVYKFTNGFNEDFKTFYLEHDGKEILSSDNEMLFTRGESYSFDVKYTFDFKETDRGYDVKIVARKNDKLQFSVNGAAATLKNGEDLTSAFTLEKNANSFVLKFAPHISIGSILSKHYSDKEISDVNFDDEQQLLYTLVVSSYNNSITYRINFGFVTPITSIGFDKTSIVF